MKLMKMFTFLASIIFLTACDLTEINYTEKIGSLKSLNNDVQSEVKYDSFEIEYDVIGKPLVGQPVTIKLQFISSLETQLVQVEFKITEQSSMIFSESQLQKINLQYIKSNNALVQTVSVIPQQEGRIYLNVEVSHLIDNVKISTLKAIPIYVDSAASVVKSDLLKIER